MWFTAALIANIGGDYASLLAWLRTPIAALLLVLLMITLFHHAALGLQVVIEDYVHSRMKIPALLAARLACLGLAATGVLATLRIAFGG